jgi:hypothetical protein
VESDEIEEVSEEVKESGHKTIGLTMAVIAVLLAFATMLGHRTHTEEIVIQAKANDQWSYFQAKNVRSHMYEANSELAEEIKAGAPVVEEFKKKSETQRKDAEEIRAKAEELEKEVVTTTRRADRFDTSEIFFEIAIVLCSITLLTRRQTYWMVSFIGGGIGLLFLGVAFLTR